ncbi:hypothetical protein [Longirhabdus pacifica]|uniref:hypothetical protein n=1 Tax=Longirhabdus pacifica TaxID=2305227 RepID=UPI001008F5AF|nr:hypothetical protein [Longirhabdus pacifica]
MRRKKKTTPSPNKSTAVHDQTSDTYVASDLDETPHHSNSNRTKNESPPIAKKRTYKAAKDKVTNKQQLGEDSNGVEDKDSKEEHTPNHMEKTEETGENHKRKEEQRISKSPEVLEAVVEVQNSDEENKEKEITQKEILEKAKHDDIEEEELVDEFAEVLEVQDEGDKDNMETADTDVIEEKQPLDEGVNELGMQHTKEKDIVEKDKKKTEDAEKNVLTEQPLDEDLKVVTVKYNNADADESPMTNKEEDKHIVEKEKTNTKPRTKRKNKKESIKENKKENIMVSTTTTDSTEDSFTTSIDDNASVTPTATEENDERHEKNNLKMEFRRKKEEMKLKMQHQKEQMKNLKRQLRNTHSISQNKSNTHVTKTEYGQIKSMYEDAMKDTQKLKQEIKQELNEFRHKFWNDYEEFKQSFIHNRPSPSSKQVKKKASIKSEKNINKKNEQ